MNPMSPWKRRIVEIGRCLLVYLARSDIKVKKNQAVKM
jgi:hypothetical protein